jgi:ribosomal protein S18 acetylase RimI-like enzyme
MLRIEHAGLHDLAGCYRVCIGTADGGEDATHRHGDPDLLGHVYVGPYLARGEGTQVVVVDDAGVSGYLLSTDDTVAFEAWQEAHWRPALRARYPRVGGDPRDAWLVERIHRPPRFAVAITDAYPAHLHIDLLVRARGSGLGRILIDRLLTELRGRGVAGVHLGVDAANTNAIGFYAHLGFARLEELPGELVMGMRLDR